jgi:hypothetical protein
VLEVPSERAGAVEDTLKKRGAWHARIGATTATRSLVVRTPAGDIELAEERLYEAWSTGAKELML